MTKQAKYKQIESFIYQKINDGEYMVGDQIPTEQELTEMFQVSRATANKAINNLAHDGILHRVAGKGTFVKKISVTKSLTSGRSFSDDIRSIGLRPGSKLISYQIASATQMPSIAEKLNLDSDEFIHFFVRIRTANDIPIAVSYTYLSATLVPSISVSVLEGSLKEYLVSLGIHDTTVHYRMSAVNATPDQQRLLNLKQSEALLLNAHITCMQGEIPYEYIETYYLSEKYTYEFTKTNSY